MQHPTYPQWVLDDSPIDDPDGYGEHAVGFFRHLRHPKSDLPDQMFGLPRFWERIVRKIYGPRDDDGERLVRQVFIMIGRGARKTTVAGGLGLYHTIGRDVRRKGGQVLVAAGSKAQAFHTFREARAMTLETPGLVYPGGERPDIVRVRGQGLQDAENPYIMHIEDETRLSVQSADGDLSHGTTPNVVIYDELHVFKSRKLWSALQTGLPKMKESLQIVITTSGRGQSGLAWDEYQYARKVARGEIVNPRYLPVLFEPPSLDADWKDRNLWAISNPGLSEGFPDAKGLAIMAEKAEGSPAEVDDFKQYHLNFWLSQSLSPFVEMTVYDEGSNAVDLESHAEFKDPCWIGVDLGWNDDISAIVIAWPDKSGAEIGYDVWAYFFCPQAKVDKRGDEESAKYQTWAEQGFLTPTEGNATDYTAIRKKLVELCETFNVQEMAFDPKFASEMINALLEKELPAVTMQQGWITMAPAIKEVDRAILSRRLNHGGHPVLRWNFENVEVHTDSAGNRLFHKGKSKDKIDGAQATAMAIGRAFVGEAPESKPIPFWLQAGFNVEDALGIGENEPDEDDAAMDAKIRDMLEGE